MPYLGCMTTDAGAGLIPAFTIGDRLRKAREVTGLDQATFAAEAGISKNTVSNAETGARRPSRLVVRAWAMRSGVPVEWLETGQAPAGEPGPDGGKYTPSDSNREPIDYEPAA